MNKKILLFLMTSVIFIFACTASHFSLARMSVSASANGYDTRQSINLPILMYHGITDQPSEVNEYTISSDMFESDLKWLGDNGFTTISAKQLINFVQDGAALPSKPVLITFDDGYSNNYDLAFPLLKKYHMKAIISVIGSASDQSTDDIYRDLFNSSLSWGEIALMAASGNVEIGNHTYDMHQISGSRRGAAPKSGENGGDYKKALISDVSVTQDRVLAATGTAPVVFAWPFGSRPQDGSADLILKEIGFEITLTSYQKTNKIRKGKPEDLFGLNRFLRTPDFDMEKIIC